MPDLKFLPLPARVVHARPRLFFSIAVSAIILAALPSGWRLATRLLIAWDAGVILYLGLSYWLIASSKISEIRRHAAREDEGRVAILAMTVAAALASMFAILIELSANGGARQPTQLLLASGTIVLSWAFTHTIFALHYAHELYGDRGGKGSGLTFPGDDKPDYWDFVYFSFVIGMTSQVSDVAVCHRPIRRQVMIHGIISFFFNAALLALTVNIAASAI